jgi:hypothetical protein
LLQVAGLVLISLVALSITVGILAFSIMGGVFFFLVVGRHSEVPGVVLIWRAIPRQELDYEVSPTGTWYMGRRRMALNDDIRLLCLH